MSVMTRKKIRDALFGLQDIEYRSFQAKLMPTVEPERLIGVRTPALKDLAKELCRAANDDSGEKKDLEVFLSDLPHEYFDEDQLHAFIISFTKEFGTCIAQVEAFLPYVDNWATCDTLSPKVFATHKEELLPYICRWMCEEKGFATAPEDTYTVRFGIGMLMKHYLNEAFDPGYPAMVAAVRSEEYYVNMMRAWYFATALAKQWDAVIPFLEERRLDEWTHRKAIQKAVESFRISNEQKKYLRTLN